MKIIKNKKGMRFDHFIIGLLVFGVVIFSGVLLINDMDETYGEMVNMSGANDSFGEVYKTMDDIYGQTEDIKGKTLADIDKDEADDGAIAAMTRGAYSALRLIPNSFNLLQGIANGIASTLGVSCNKGGGEKICFYVDLVVIIMTLMMLFSLIYMIFRFRP